MWLVHRWLAGASALIVLAGCSSSSEKAEKAEGAAGGLPAQQAATVPVLDTRVPVPLPPEGVEAVRAEMRTMLSSLHQLNQALVARDSALARRAAIASGVAAAADPKLEPLLPPEFLKLGMETHAAFDSVAVEVAAGATRDSLLAHLPRLTANCVACHAIYRLVGRPAAP